MVKIPDDERFISDEEVFAAFDLSYPGLKSVKAALDGGDKTAAKKRWFSTLKREPMSNTAMITAHCRCAPLKPTETPTSFSPLWGWRAA